MLYDNSNPLQKAQFLTRSKKLADSGKLVELTEKKPRRSLNQNSYLFLLLGYWGSQTGYTKDEAESLYKDINKDIYHIEREVCGRVIRDVRHTYELDTAEMTLSIERFRNFSAANEAMPIYLPAPNEELMLREMEIEAQRCKEFL